MIRNPSITFSAMLLILGFLAFSPTPNAFGVVPAPEGGYPGGNTAIGQAALLIAKEVANVDPDLVVRDREGKIYSVRYDAVDAMRLNEFLNEHKKVQYLEAAVAQQQKGIEAATTQLKEQDIQVQRVSAQIELTKSAPQAIASNPNASKTD